MNFFESQLRRLFGDTEDARFIGRCCFIPADDGNLVKAEFVTQGVHAEYVALQMSVINRADDGYFAFTSVPDNSLSYFCSASQFPERFMTNWSSDDHGCGWVLIENPNVEADLSVLEVVGIDNTIVEAREADIYSISGLRLNSSAARLAKGIYIVNRKKVVIK